MCNEYQLRLSWDPLEIRQLKIPVRWTHGPANRPLNQPFKPTDRAPVLRPADPDNPLETLQSVEMRWWLVPARHRGPPNDWKNLCTNARLETVDKLPSFAGPYARQRCLVPLTDFIEYDTLPDWKPKTPKRRWSISWNPQDDTDRVRYFAGVWDRWEPPGGEALESFAFVTGPPGQAFSAPQPDTGKPLHSRQARVLTFEQGMEWLRLDGPGKAMLWDPEPVGRFVITPRPRELETA